MDWLTDLNICWLFSMQTTQICSSVPILNYADKVEVIIMLEEQYYIVTMKMFCWLSFISLVTPGADC